MRLPKFNSLEEVKEFISSTDSSIIGAINFIDSEGKSIQMSMDDFIKKVGLDEAAEFIYKTSNEGEMKGVQFSKDELNKILEKFKNDPDSLTEEEKTILYLVMQDMKSSNNIFSVANDLFTLFTKSIVDVGGNLTSTYSGLLSVILTFMEDTFTLSSDLAVHMDNQNTYNEIVKSVTDQIVIPEGIDEACLLIGLFHIIGERFVGSDLTRNMKVNYHDFANRLGLDMDFLFGEKQEVSSIPDDVENLEKELLPDVKSFLGLNKPESKEKCNVVNLDIRKTLKEDKL